MFVFCLHGSCVLFTSSLFDQKALETPLAVPASKPLSPTFWSQRNPFPLSESGTGSQAGISSRWSVTTQILCSDAKDLRLTLPKFLRREEKTDHFINDCNQTWYLAVHFGSGAGLGRSEEFVDVSSGGRDSWGHGGLSVLHKSERNLC